MGGGELGEAIVREKDRQFGRHFGIPSVQCRTQNGGWQLVIPILVAHPLEIGGGYPPLAAIPQEDVACVWIQLPQRGVMGGGTRIACMLSRP